MIGEVYRPVDFVARMAQAWDMLGRHALAAGGTEHKALLALAYLPEELARVRWNELTGEQRWRLVQGARKAIDLGRAAAWVFGEGNGA